MKQELQDKLFADFPKIFPPDARGSGSLIRSIGCGDGWFNLIYELCSAIQWEIDQHKSFQLVARQIKDKFFELRFYSDGGDDRTSAMISFAEQISRKICSRCGSFGIEECKCK